MDIRTTSTTLTQTHREAGVIVSSPTTIVTATAVLANPLAGQGLVQDLSSLDQLGNDAAAGTSFAWAEVGEGFTS
jgi:hypothetical protein